jgi:hypothetical protein
MTYSSGNALYGNYPPPVASDKSGSENESEEEYSGSDSESSDDRTFTVKHRGHLIDDDNINDRSDRSDDGINAMTAVLNKKNHCRIKVLIW